VIARAAMASPPPMQREAIRRAVVAIRAVGTVRALALLRRLMRLAAGNERWQPLHIRLACRLDVLLRARLDVLLLNMLLLNMLLLNRLLLNVLRLLHVRLLLLLARVERLRLARRERLAADGRLLIVAVVIVVVGTIAARLAARLVIGLALAKLLLRGRDQTEIMLGVLRLVFGCDRVSGALRITGKLEILLGDVRCRSPNFHVRSIGLVHA
jgi:hypothetical protein